MIEHMPLGGLVQQIYSIGMASENDWVIEGKFESWYLTSNY